jgi:hypothetical protein
MAVDGSHMHKLLLLLLLLIMLMKGINMHSLMAWTRWCAAWFLLACC